jgi:hypothetical protein
MQHMAPGIKTGGRKKGSKNKRQTALKETAEIAARAALAGLTPLEFMLALMRDETRDIVFRAEMAKSAAPYVHQKLVATDNLHRAARMRTDQSIAELRDELLQDMVEAGLVTLLPGPPAPEPAAPAGVANRKPDGTTGSGSPGSAHCARRRSGTKC